MARKTFHKKYLESKRFVDYGFKVGKGKDKSLSAAQKRMINQYHEMLFGVVTQNGNTQGGIANGHKQYVQPRRKDRRKSLQRSQEQGGGAGFPRLKGVFISRGIVDDRVKVRYDSNGHPVFKSMGPDGYREIRRYFDPISLAKDSDREVQSVLDEVPPPDPKGAKEVIVVMVGDHEQHATIQRGQIKREVKRLMAQTGKGGSGLSPDLVRGLVFKHYPFIGSAKDYRKRRQQSMDKLQQKKDKKHGLKSRGGKRR